MLRLQCAAVTRGAGVGLAAVLGCQSGDLGNTARGSTGAGDGSGSGIASTTGDRSRSSDSASSGTGSGTAAVDGSGGTSGSSDEATGAVADSTATSTGAASTGTDSGGTSESSGGSDSGTGGVEPIDCSDPMIQVAGLLETDFVTVEFDEVPRYDIRTSRDIDATTDGCYVNFTVTLGSSEHGCELELGGFTAARDGRLVVDGVEFLAGADCPMFPDTWEGRYEAEGAELEGSWIEPNPAAIPDPTPGGECVAATVHLRGTLEQQSGPGALTIAGSTLHLARMFPIVEVGAACPIECEADHHCAPSEYCGLDQVCSPGPRYDVRVDGVTNRLEVLQRGEWRGVCWGGWSSEDTEVACRELTGSPTGTASSDGVGNVQAWLASTGCDGSESSLRDCTGSWGHRICPDGSVELRCGV